MLRLLILLLVLAAAPAAAQDRIDRLFTTYLARESIPGAVLVILRDDGPPVSRAWGVADRAQGIAMTPDAVQPLYSVSKQFTAALILRLAEQGRIELDAPVARYLPAWFADEPALKVRHLLRHTSGLPNFIGWPQVRAIEQAAPGTLARRDARPDRCGAEALRTGRAHAYSNSNYTVLALIAERVSGRRSRRRSANCSAPAGARRDRGMCRPRARPDRRRP